MPMKTSEEVCEDHLKHRYLVQLIISLSLFELNYKACSGD